MRQATTAAAILTLLASSWAGEGLAQAPGLSAAQILKPAVGSWPTHSGDYSGRRYSPLKQINRSNVKNLTLAWSTKLDYGPTGAVIGGRGPEPAANGAFSASLKGSPLIVDGIIYMAAPDHVWALDARSGAVLWRYFWKSRGGTHVGNRGVGMWKNYLYVETPDNYLISLDARTGKERWNVEIASFDEQYFSTTAPIIIDDHVLVGTGNDLDAPGFLQSFDPETGKLQWKFYTVPMNPGDPGLETWKDLDAARHGGGNPWMPGSYDPETRLYIVGTGNPSPAYFADVRGNGDALFTCSMVAVDVDTGKMRWYYQTSPNDTHDWDSAQTPVLADIRIGGRLRKVAMTAARNGYFFVVDRITGEHLVTSKFSDTINWARPELNAKGQPVRIPEKDSGISGALVSSSNAGAANWPPPAYNPDAGLFYVGVTETWSLYYLAETDPRGAMGLGGRSVTNLGGSGYLKAIDPRTGKIRWSIPFVGGGDRAGTGLLTTAGGLVFSGDSSGNLVARSSTTGLPLWHVPLGLATNAPVTYALDGQQYILAGSGDTMIAFKLY